ncbi:hypothetical protein [Paenibacillus gallinarum]|uniref:Uncharacterized protein n=1 Tax=Paenibacillus gallinarum TaxID=2762232 RepID=A0ABR8T694_9BACL|nr:hypothetical protein [Paenibacillus gallinarum]MBD7971287.1 hypothetical protein [Paenibacillus gallinarum]
MIKQFEFDFEGRKFSGRGWAGSNGLIEIDEKTLDLDSEISKLSCNCKDIEDYEDFIDRLCEALNKTKLFNREVHKHFLDIYVITMDDRMIEYPPDDYEDYVYDEDDYDEDMESTG